jgi:hypothetical protein
MEKERGNRIQRTHPYAGRWIARIRGQVVGQGGTIEQALASAYSSRFKEIPILSYIPLQQTMPFSDLVFEIQKILRAEKQVYLVGGAVRDALMGRENHDLDLVCMADTRRLAHLTADSLHADVFTLDPDRGMYRVIVHPVDGVDTVVDFSDARGKTLVDDLTGRDFSINAIAVDIQDPYKLIDPLGGARAIRDKVLTACSPRSMEDDPVRVLRGIRFAARLGFRLEEATRAQMKAAASRLGDVTMERRRDEIVKILASGRPDTALRAVDWLKGLDFILPGIEAIRLKMGRDWWNDVLAELQSAQLLLNLLRVDRPHTEAGDLAAGLAAMKLGRFSAEIADHFRKPVLTERERESLFLLSLPVSAMAAARNEDRLPEDIGRELKLSRQEGAYLDRVCRGEKLCRDLQGRTTGALEVYRFYKQSSDAGVDAVLAHAAVVHASQKLSADSGTWLMCLDTCQSLLEGWWNHYEEWVNPPVLVNGDELISECNLTPGPQIGEWLTRIREKQVCGELSNPQEAIAWVRSQMRK